MWFSLKVLPQRETGFSIRLILDIQTRDESLPESVCISPWSVQSVLDNSYILKSGEKNPSSAIAFSCCGKLLWTFHLSICIYANTTTCYNSYYKPTTIPCKWIIIISRLTSAPKSSGNLCLSQARPLSYSHHSPFFRCTFTNHSKWASHI